MGIYNSLGPFMGCLVLDGISFCQIHLGFHCPISLEVQPPPNCKPRDSVDLRTREMRQEGLGQERRFLRAVREIAGYDQPIFGYVQMYEWRAMVPIWYWKKHGKMIHTGNKTCHRLCTDISCKVVTPASISWLVYKPWLFTINPSESEVIIQLSELGHQRVCKKNNGYGSHLII